MHGLKQVLCALGRVVWWNSDDGGFSGHAAAAVIRTRAILPAIVFSLLESGGFLKNQHPISTCITNGEHLIGARDASPSVERFGSCPSVGGECTAEGVKLLVYKECCEVHPPWHSQVC